MAELWLVCEGEPGSVDVAVLKPVLTNILAAEIIVESACGSSPNVVAPFLEKHRGGRAAYLRDRDYKPRAQAESALTDGRPGFYWRRHSIENYLLHPVVFIRSFNRLRRRFEQQHSGRIPRWFAALPTVPEQVADMLRECAALRAAEEACRLAAHRLWAVLPESVGQIQKRIPKPQLPGTVAPSDWREALCQEVERVRNAAARTASASEFETSAAVTWFDAAYAEMSASAYVAGLEFLIDFHGRDLLKAFKTRLSDIGVTLTYERLVDELIGAVVEEYAGNRAIYGSDDFRDLANGVRSLAQLPALA